MSDPRSQPDIRSSVQRLPDKVTWRSWVFWYRFAIAAVIFSLIIATDVFPIITNDSLGYLVHSNGLTEGGWIEVGYRQFGYPTFLAAVDAVGTAIRIEPLLLTVVIQRFLMLSALGFAAYLWRWRAVPLIGFALLPTLLGYTNFILNEGLAVGVVLWYATLVAWTLRMSQQTDRPDPHLERSLMTGVVLVAISYLLLVTTRLYLVMLGFGLVAVLLALYRIGGRLRRVAMIALVSVTVLGAGLVYSLSAENSDEYGVFAPAVRGERAQFWVSWQETFSRSPENVNNSNLTDLYADGDPYAVMSEIDRLPTYDDQRERYHEVIGRMFEERGTSWTEERLHSMWGVFNGGNIDDVHGIVVAASESSFDTVEDLIYRNPIARREGTDYINDVFNDGRDIQPILTSGLAPLRTFPYFSTVARWLLPTMMLLMALGLLVPRARRLAIIGLLSLGGSAVLLGFFLQDSVRVALLPMLFGIALGSAVLNGLWEQGRLRRSAAPLMVGGGEQTDSSEREHLEPDLNLGTE